MPKFMFHPDPIDKYEFNPIPVDIHLRIVQIPTDEIIDDFGNNTTKVMLIGTDSNQVLNSLQKAFALVFNTYGKLKESEIRPMDYTTGHAWSRIRNHIKIFYQP